MVRQLRLGLSATSLRLAARINGHVQPTRAVKVDTLLTEEKARAKLIERAKLKFGISEHVDVQAVRLYIKGMAPAAAARYIVQLNPTQPFVGAASPVNHLLHELSAHLQMADRHRPYPTSDPPQPQVSPFWLWGGGYPLPKLAPSGGPRGGSEAQVGPFGEGRG